MINKEENKRILFVGDGLGHYSGLAYVITSIMSRLIKESPSIEFGYVSITNTHWDNKPESLSIFNPEYPELFKDVKFYNSNVKDEQEYALMNDIIYDFKPHIVFSMGDIWLQVQLAYSNLRNSYYWAVYQNIECSGYPKTLLFPNNITGRRVDLHNVLSKPDCVIPYTQMGKDLFTKWYGNDPRIKDPILHGLDMYELPEDNKKDEIRSKIRKGYNIPDESFVFMTLGTNSARKQIDQVLDAFELFLSTRKDKDKYILIIHSYTDIILNGVDLEEIISSSELLNGQVLITNADSLSPIHKQLLMDEYYMSDCYISLPAAEGFGYGFAEAMLTGKPVIYSDYGGHVEYCRGCGIEVPTQRLYRMRNSNLMWSLPDISAAAKAMVTMATDKIVYKKYSDAAIKTAKSLSWDNIYPKIKQVVEEDFNKKEKNKLYGIPRRFI